MLRYALLLFCILTLVACKQKNEFVQHSENLTVIDVTHRDIIVNGEKVGSAIDEISESTAPIVASIENAVRSKAAPSVNVHLERFERYDVFYKVASSIAAAKIVKGPLVTFAFGNDYSNGFALPSFVLNAENPCTAALSSLNFVGTQNSGAQMTSEEKHQQMIENKKMELECAENYLSQRIFITSEGSAVKYSLGYNYSGIVGGHAYTAYDSESEMWDAMAAILAKDSFKDKLDLRKVTLIAAKDVPMNVVADMVLKLKNKGYVVYFSNVEK